MILLVDRIPIDHSDEDLHIFYFMSFTSFLFSLILSK